LPPCGNYLCFVFIALSSEPVMKRAEPAADVLRSTPIRRIGCCARTASGHAAAPPSSVMKSRRFTAR
jgi:hypothetical protein